MFPPSQLPIQTGSESDVCRSNSVDRALRIKCMSHNGVRNREPGIASLEEGVSGQDVEDSEA